MRSRFVTNFVALWDVKENIIRHNRLNNHLTIFNSVKNDFEILETYFLK